MHIILPIIMHNNMHVIVDDYAYDYVYYAYDYGYDYVYYVAYYAYDYA